MATIMEDVIGGRSGGFLGGDNGGGMLGGLLIGALLGNGGFGGFGNRNDRGDCNRDCVTPADLNSQTLGDIKAAIPYNEAQVQLALAQAMASLTQQNNVNQMMVTQGISNLMLQAANQTAQLQGDIANVDTNVDRQSCLIQTAIHNDGEATRALITANRIADLEQQLTVSQLRESEQRGINRDQVNSHNITIQMQQQQQQQQLAMRDLQYQLGYITQRAAATNSTVQVGNTGAATAGAQTANPTNVVA